MFHIIFLGLWIVVSILVVSIIEDNKLKMGVVSSNQEFFNTLLAVCVAGFVVYLPLLGIYYLIWEL